MLSNKLKEYRSKTKITQEDLAEQLCVSRSAVAKWEQGKGIPSKQSLKDLEKLMGVSQEELLQEDEHYQIIENINKSYTKDNNIKKLLLIISGIILLILTALLIIYIRKSRVAPIKYCSELEVITAYFADKDHNFSTDDINENYCGYIDESHYLFIILKHSNKSENIYFNYITLLDVDTNEKNKIKLNESYYADNEYYRLRVKINCDFIGEKTFRLIELSCFYNAETMKELSYKDISINIKERKTYTICFKLFDKTIKYVSYQEDRSIYIKHLIDENLNNEALRIIYQFCEKYNVDLSKNRWMLDIKWAFDKGIATNEDLIVNATFGYDNNNFNIENLGINYSVHPQLSQEHDYIDYNILSDNQVGLCEFYIEAELNDKLFNSVDIRIKNDEKEEYRRRIMPQEVGILSVDLALHFELLGIAGLFTIYTPYTVEVVPYKIVNISYVTGEDYLTYVPIDEITYEPIVNIDTVSNLLYDYMYLQVYKDDFKRKFDGELNIAGFEKISDSYFVKFDSEYEIKNVAIKSENYNEEEDVYYLNVGRSMDLKVLMNNGVDLLKMKRARIDYISSDEEVIDIMCGKYAGTATVIIRIELPYYIFEETMTVIVVE